MDFSSVIKERVIKSQRLSGGSIGESFRVSTVFSNFFVKYYNKKGLARKEAHSLNEIKKCPYVAIPEIFSFDDNFLVLDFIEQGVASRNYQSELGVMLASMHKFQRAENFGFYEDNYIGLTPQINKPKKRWIDFLLENRLGFQIELSKDIDLIKIWKDLSAIIPDIIDETEEQASLIHGDLWGGNLMKDSKGNPVLIDPASYYAHREMELGMTKLFGGFTSGFYKSYNKTFPLERGWERRIDIYMLYHVLNHYNMFGGGYKHQALSIMKSFL